MNKKEIIEEFFKISEKTYYNHKRDKRPVVELVDTYFTDNELEEFLKTKQIRSFNNMKEFNEEHELMKNIMIDVIDNIFIEITSMTRNKLEYLIKSDDKYLVNYNIMKLPFFIFLSIIDETAKYKLSTCEKQIKEIVYSEIIKNKQYLDYDRLFLLLKSNNKILCQVIKYLNVEKYKINYFNSSNIYKIPNLFKIYNNFKELSAANQNIILDEDTLEKIYEIYKDDSKKD